MANLPPVSLTSVASCYRYQQHYIYSGAAGDVDTGGIFATGVVDAGGKLTTGAPSHGKIRNYPNVIFGGLGEDDS